MDRKILLEVPVFSVEAALLAARYGADRLELCSSVAEGGETPGPGIFSYLKRKINIPIFVMIRPRGGDFVYSADEMDVMKEEIRTFSSMGADGFVFGMLTPDGRVDKDACKALVLQAGSKPCTFHRAIDVCKEINEALEDVIDCGFQRILTSGGKNSVDVGMDVICELMTRANDRIIVMPGGGMKPELVELLQKSGFLKEIHAGCKKVRRSKSRYLEHEVEFASVPLKYGQILTVDKALVKAYKQ